MKKETKWNGPCQRKCINPCQENRFAYSYQGKRDLSMLSEKQLMYVNEKGILIHVNEKWTFVCQGKMASC